MKKYVIALTLLIALAGLGFAAQQARADIYGTSLVAYYPLDITSASQNIPDASGNGNNGALGQATSSVPAKVGQGILFSGVANDTNSIIIPNSTSVNVVGNITMATWVYPKVSNVYQALIDRSNGAGASRQYAVYLSVNGVCQLFVALGGTNIGDQVVNPCWKINIWNHIAITADGVNVKFYVNCVLAKTFASAALPTSQAFKLYLGREVGNNFSLNGAMDDARIYNRALSQADICQLYNMGVAKHHGHPF